MFSCLAVAASLSQDDTRVWSCEQVVAVSYTHLDVYKRQVYVSSVSVLEHAVCRVGKVTEAWPLEPHAELRGAYTQTCLLYTSLTLSSDNN